MLRLSDGLGGCVTNILLNSWYTSSPARRSLLGVSYDSYPSHPWSEGKLSISACIISYTRIFFICRSCQILLITDWQPTDKKIVLRKTHAPARHTTGQWDNSIFSPQISIFLSRTSCRSFEHVKVNTYTQSSILSNGMKICRSPNYSWKLSPISGRFFIRILYYFIALVSKYYEDHIYNTHETWGSEGEQHLSL